MNTDFLIESRLAKLNKNYHELVANTAFVVIYALEKYKTIFPNYTDHTISHSLNVLDFCNKLIGYENIDKLNDDELYVLIMAAYLHDTGMGLSEKDFNEFHGKIISKDFENKNPNYKTCDLIRTFHNDFSAEFIKKYAELLEIPNDELTYAIAQASKGHRKADLLNIKEYNPCYKLSNNNTICLPYLAVLIRLADELDIAIDRIFSFEYDDPIYNTINVRGHHAIKKMEITDDAFVYYIDCKTQDVCDYVTETIEKLKITLKDCLEVLHKRTNFDIKQKTVKVIKLEGSL